MILDIKIYRARFQTAGKTSEEIRSEFEQENTIGLPPTDEEVEMWKETLNAMDGVEVFVTDSFIASDGNFIIISWPESSEEKMLEFVYAAEQDSMFGTYQNEREQFIKDWNSGKYEPEGTLVLSASDLKIIEELKRKDD